MDFPAHPFWDFALDVYRQPGVSEACLQLQERDHVDVNLLLFACWVGASGGGRLNRDEVERCRDAVGPWHDAVVRPLRGVRRTLKGGLGAAIYTRETATSEATASGGAIVTGLGYDIRVARNFSLSPMLTLWTSTAGDLKDHTTTLNSGFRHGGATLELGFTFH